MSDPNASYRGASLLLLAVVLATLGSSRIASAYAPASGYKCYVLDSLTSGIVPNTIQAEGSVDCAGYGARGSVTFTVKLKKYNPTSKKWPAIGTKSKTYRTLRARHVLAVSKSPCVPGAYRGSYTAVLRDVRGGLVSVNAQKLATLHVGAGCAVH